jgi:chromosome segregation ATPase
VSYTEGEFARLLRRARNAEAERDAARAELDTKESEIHDLCFDLNDTNARLDAVIAELAHKTEHWKVERTLRLEAEARLDAVIALIDPEVERIREARGHSNRAYPSQCGQHFVCSHCIRAAARGDTK